MIYKIEMEKYEIKNISIIYTIDNYLSEINFLHFTECFNKSGCFAYYKTTTYYNTKYEYTTINMHKYIQQFLREQKLNIILNDL